MHAKLKNSPGIYLVGFMGCGKTSVGELLAERLAWDFVDLDSEIERHAGSRIVEIFEQLGEPAFRALESQALVSQLDLIKQGRARVVALGGGTFVDARNRSTIERFGVSIWLDGTADQLWERVSDNDERPLGRDRAAFETLHRKRRPDYEKADFRVDIGSRTTQEVVEAISQLELV